eukprot:CAMPEP_0113543092 /NCGR_PEP_ID=MMETSP0015_2-20120614/9973_1 /TAXON_ID=2838 /ORGANISM="Odontella" /LENGTH=64 /DNA_ID=CAMNT_0000443227 /DNA_START=103 /DNA_END=294 /DNA_ORIENTATION=+ /assembly_acc=CAM_ASM_000160
MKLVKAALVFAAIGVSICLAQSSGRDEGYSRDGSKYEKVEGYDDKRNRRKAQLEKVLGDTIQKL